MREFKVGDEVKVIGGCFGDLSKYKDRTGVIESIEGRQYNPYRIKGFDDTNDYCAEWSANELELIEESEERPMKFKAGDRVEVIDTHSLTLAKNGDKGTVKSVDDEGYLEVVFDNGGSCDAWQVKRFKVVEDKPMTYRDALLHTLNGTMTVRHTSMDTGEYLVFDDGFKGSKGWCGAVVVCQEHTGNWEEYIVPTPPKFTIDSLVYNADGTIGKVVEDKGIHKGERCYSVRYNAVRDVTKHVKESELTLYVL